MTRHLSFACLLFFLSVTLSAGQTTIVDTGPGPTQTAGLELNSLQYLAVEFNVPAQCTINDVEGWLSVVRGGTLDLSLYRDGGETPGSLVYRSNVFLNSGSVGWRGTSSLDWLVAPGTYWLGFEPRGLTSFNASMPIPSEHPLTNGALVDPESSDIYVPADGVAPLGVRIVADEPPGPVATPEPTPFICLIAVAVGIVIYARRVPGDNFV